MDNKRKKYNESTKASRLKYQQEYRRLNRETVKGQRKSHYLKNKDQWRQAYWDNRDQVLDRMKKDYKKNRVERLAHMKEYQQSTHGKYTSYKTNAHKRKIEWDLTEEQFMTFWQKACYYCHRPITTIGLDRIDSSRGYTLNNVLPCCWRHNAMKSDLSKEDFILECNAIAKLHPRP